MSDLSSAAKANLEAARQSDGTFGPQPHSNPPRLRRFNEGLLVACVLSIALGLYQVTTQGSRPWILLPALFVGGWALTHLKD